MGGLRSIVGGIVIDKILSARPSAASKNKSYHIMMAFAGLFVFVGVIFLLISLYHCMLQQYTPDIAALITAGASMGIALLTVLAAHTMREYHRPKMERNFNEMKSQFESALKGMEGEWEHPIREHPKTAMALAALAGYFLADRIS